MIEYIIIIFIIVIYSTYIYLINSFYTGFKRIKPFKTNKELIPSYISCIIPFRNEEKNIAQTIKSLQNQKLSSKYFEIIFIDDFSTDNSFITVKQLIANNPNFKVIRNTTPGKKNAIKLGIKNANNSNIITTDADCIHHPDWLNSISQFITLHKPDLIIAPVLLSPINSFLDYFQHLDFLSLIISGAGACEIKNPIMGNGANLIFTKDLYLNASSSIFNRYASGDDIFLLHYAKSTQAKILFLKNISAAVKTKPVENLKAFFNQRVRWASKSKGYTDKYTIYTAWSVFITNFISSLLPLIYFISIHIFATCCIMFICKIYIDFKLLKSGSKYYKLPFKIKTFLISQLVYPYYISITVFYSAFGNVKWKGRDTISTNN